MRGILAEQRDGSNPQSGDASSRGGYALKPSAKHERSSMDANRSGGGKRSSGGYAEVRLGKVQIAVWLGLAIGSIVGAYFIGFFSGRYVGFESARESSGGEVAKLPVPELFNDLLARNPGGVYEKLKNPAVLKESPENSAPEQIVPQQIPQNAIGTNDPAHAADTSLAVPSSRARGGFAATRANIPEGGDKSNGDGQANQDPGDQLFEQDFGGAELIIGAEEAEKREIESVPGSVRMLGDNKSNPAKVEVAKVDNSAADLLEERVANARTVTPQPNLKSTDNDVVALEPVSKKVVDTASLVRKVVPSGYFAQVAAPKKLAEAEGIAKKLKRSGFPVIVESATVAGQSFYRVLVGPEDNKLQADRLVSQLKSESYIAGDPFIRKIK